MGLFRDENEPARKLKLEQIEDKRLAFAKELQNMHFAPEEMVFVSNEAGGFFALCNDNGNFCLIFGASFSRDDDFSLVRFSEKPVWREEEFFEAGTGMNGMFGFGKKGISGAKIYITLPGGDEACVPVLANCCSALIVTKAKKNPLFPTSRRRGNANIVWEFLPLEKRYIRKVHAKILEILP